jgi:hypothetical protein
MFQNNINEESAPQEEIPLKTFSFVQSLVKRKLGNFYADYVEDITQTVLLNLFKWKSKRIELEISEEDWLKIANVAAQNEVKSFYTHKWRREVPTESDELNQIADIAQNLKTEGNSDIEIRSLLNLIWETYKELSFKQKYSLILSNKDFIFELIANKCCGLSEISATLNMSESEFILLLEKIPFTDIEISQILEDYLKETVSARNVWKARTRAKLNLIRTLKRDK